MRLPNNYLFTFVLFVAISQFTFAQDLNLDLNFTPTERDRSMPEELPMDVDLYVLCQYAKAPTSQETSISVLDRMQSLSYFTMPDGRVLVGVRNETKGRPISREIVAAVGGEVISQWRYLADVYIAPDKLIDLAKRLPKDYFLYAQALSNDFEGISDSVTNSFNYKANGADGKGKTVAVIDNGYASFNLMPYDNYGTTYDTVDFTGNGFLSGGTHGQACAGRVFDHAPGANFLLYNAPGESAMGNAFDDAISKNVDVITLSQSAQNTGWDDNTGTRCEQVHDATDAGAIVFCSSGNRGNKHWEGNFSDPDNDDWHNWLGGVELNMVELDSSNSGNPGTISVSLQWDYNGIGDLSTYELYLVNVVNGQIQGVVQSDIGWLPLKRNRFVSYTQANKFQKEQIGIAVRDRGITGTPKFEIVVTGSGVGLFDVIGVNIPAGSTTSPSNSTDPNVISVGGVEFDVYAPGSGASGLIVNYSSQGPTNNGNLAPRITGPTKTGNFHGTSCSTPESAGACLALWSTVPNYSRAGIRYLIYELAHIFKDWGANGPDNVYGHGGIYLYDYAPGTVWVDNRFNNVQGLPFGPYYFVQHARDAVPNNGRMMFIGQSYPLPITMAMPKSFLMKTIGYHATVGD